jgi:hypothetical protein
MSDLEQRLATVERRLDDLDERVAGSTAWLVAQARTVTLMTANEGMELLRWALGRYDERHGARHG